MVTEETPTYLPFRKRSKRTLLPNLEKFTSPNCLNNIKQSLLKVELRNPLQSFFTFAYKIWAGSKKVTTSYNLSHTLQWWNLAQLYLTYKRSRNTQITWHTTWVQLISWFFDRKLTTFVTSKNTNVDCILMHSF